MLFMHKWINVGFLTGLQDISAKQMATASEEPKTISSNLLKQYRNEKKSSSRRRHPQTVLLRQMACNALFWGESSKSYSLNPFLYNKEI